MPAARGEFGGGGSHKSAKPKRKRYMPPATSRSDAAQRSSAPTPAPAVKGPPTPARKPLSPKVRGKAYAHVGVKAKANVGKRRGGIPFAAQGLFAGTASKLLKPVIALGDATIHHPLGVIKHTAEGGVEIVKAVPSGVVNTVLHPEQTGKAIIKDYLHRYGQSYDDMVKRFETEGAAPEVADALAVGSLGGATAGKLAVAGLRKEGVSAVTKARPALRVSGGIVKEQELADTLGRLAAQRAHDALRGRKTRKAARKLEDPTQTGVDAVAAEAARTGQVVRLRPAKLDRSLAKSVAQRKSRAVHRMKSEQHRRVDVGARRVLKDLNKHERRAFYYVAAGIAPAERAGFEHFLGRRVENIRAARAEHGEPQGLTRLTDELRTIPQIDTAKIDFAKLRRVHDELRQDAIRIGREDPALNTAQRLQRRYAQQAETLGLRRGEVPHSTDHGVPAIHYGEESLPDYIRRVQKAADEHGLSRPIYFPSERFSLDLHPDYASRAVGGARAVAGPRRYEGTNFRLGLQDTSPETFLTGMARNLKRKHNWKLVADLADDHAIGGVRGPAQLVRQAMMDRGIAPASYQLWNPNIWRGHMTKAMEQLDEPGAAATEAADMAGFNALKEATRADDPAYAQVGGWVAIPKKAWQELEDSTKPSGLAGRSWDIFKGKNSRILLGAGNIPWLQFQVASNALLGLGATRLMLGTDLPKAMAWWRGLDEGSKEEMNALLGTGITHDTQQVHLGATTNSSIVKSWRAFKEHPVWTAGGKYSLSKLNPIEAMFRMDHAQTAAFKRAVLYNHIKREAFKRMGRDAGVAQRLQGRIVHALTLGPKDAMDAVMRDPRVLERQAQAVNDWLGDYVTYTARERKLLSRSVMFYGFLRYSLKFTFYTMPVTHPLQTAIVGKLGQLQADEVKELLGGQTLPWAFGKLYLTDDGRLQEVDLTRANPALNMIADTMSGHPSSWVSVAPPMLVALAEQLPGVGARRFYFDRPWYVDSHGFGSRVSDYTPEQRARILGEELLDMAAPYRLAEKLTMHGPQGDDSMLFDPRPTTNRGTRRYDAAKRKKYLYDANFDAEHDTLLNTLVPLLPRPSRDATDAELQQHINSLKPARGHHRARRHKTYFGASGGESHYYGASPSGGSHYFGAQP